MTYHIFYCVYSCTLNRWRKGKKRDSGSGASNQIKFSTKMDEVDMEGNAAYATTEYGWHHHNDYHEETMSINDKNALIRPLQIPPRIRADEAIPTIPVSISLVGVHNFVCRHSCIFYTCGTCPIRAKMARYTY